MTTALGSEYRRRRVSKPGAADLAAGSEAEPGPAGEQPIERAEGDLA